MTRFRWSFYLEPTKGRMRMLAFLPFKRCLGSVVKIRFDLYFVENSIKHFQQTKDRQSPAKKATFGVLFL